MSLTKVSSVSSELSDVAESKDGDNTYHVSKSRLVSLISWVQVLRIYLPATWFFVIGILVTQILKTLYDHRFDFQTFFSKEIPIVAIEKGFALDLGWKSMALLAFLIWYITNREKPVFLLDFSVFEPPDSWKITTEQTIDIMRAQGCYTQESIEFMDRMLQQSGVGPATAWPPGILPCLKGEPTDLSTEQARREAEIIIFDCVRNVLEKTNTKARDVDFLIINCSLFSPTPSLCSMVVNEFKMRADVSSYNLSGMGCSAGLISIELAKNLLNSRPNSTVLVVSTEIITPNLYTGNERGFLLQNILFRCGGAAIVLTNKWTDAYRSLFKLLTVVRTQYVSEDSYGCVYEAEDTLRRRGVRLSKDIVKVAGRAMEKNFITMGPHVLPTSEQIKTGFWMLIRFMAKQAKSFGVDFGKVNPYIPDFKRGIDHFCIHAGGRGVIDGIEKNLNLTPKHIAASRYALFAYGNTSSSSIWYEMDYIRKYTDMSRGNRVLQVAFGSGFKCNSAAWLCLRGVSKKYVAKNSRNKLE